MYQNVQVAAGPQDDAPVEAVFFISLSYGAQSLLRMFLPPTHPSYSSFLYQIIKKHSAVLPANGHQAIARFEPFEPTASKVAFTHRAIAVACVELVDPSNGVSGMIPCTYVRTQYFLSTISHR